MATPEQWQRWEDARWQLHYELMQWSNLIWSVTEALGTATIQASYGSDGGVFDTLQGINETTIYAQNYLYNILTVTLVEYYESLNQVIYYSGSVMSDKDVFEAWMRYANQPTS